MNKVFTLPVSTIFYVPRSVRPLSANVISTELRHAWPDGIWGFACLSLLPKAVLCTPSRGERKKLYVGGALISSWLHCWQDGELIALWLEAHSDAKSRQSTHRLQ